MYFLTIFICSCDKCLIEELCINNKLEIKINLKQTLNNSNISKTKSPCKKLYYPCGINYLLINKQCLIECK